MTRVKAPLFGRWLDRDPLDEPGGVNRYAFGQNNPISYVDPIGAGS